MFDKKILIPILIIAVLAVMVYGLLHGQKVATQGAVKVDKPVEVESPATAPKPPPPGETHETGHWHGDEWHAEPHEETHTPVEPPVTAETQVSPTRPSREPPSWASWDFQAAYQGLREAYPDQTKNPPPFENVPVDLWDFEATKTAFMENFNFYVKHYDPKEGWSHTRELRIAAANMENIDNAAEPTFGLFTPEQCEEIHEMHRRYFEFKGVKVNHDRVWKLVHDDGYSVLEALKISREESNR